MDGLQFIATGILATIWIVVAAAAVLIFFFKRRLRTHFPTDWQALGEPTWYRNTMENSIRLFQYLVIKRSYRIHHDSKLENMGDYARSMFLVLLALLAAFLLVIIAGQHGYRHG